ncbi:O-antigen ligase family protein [Sphingomonas sp. 35-24ZXX]|uniref:O-antigen ligase family protein n=1 Tax=Sphingomonas sp. 35-24ZXX TaxID=1545915 RepID=UPI0012DFEE5F|nr:hypothetical protein [Sphingomonas sp. 35-24ZXX]
MIRQLFWLASVFFTLNVAETLNLPFANVFEKGLYLLLAGLVLVLRRVDPVAITLMIATLILTIVLGLATPFPKFSWATWLLSINQFAIIYVLTGFHATRDDADGILRATTWLPVICMIGGLIGLGLSGRPIWGIEYATGTMRLQGSQIPAFLSGLAANGIVASLILGLEWRRLRYLGFTAVNLIILILAGGRASLAVAMIASICVIVFSKVIHIRDKLMLLTGGLLALPFFAAIAVPFALRRLATSTDNGRNAMAAYLQTLVDQYSWTGIGFGHQYWQTPSDVVVLVGSAAAHNDYLRLTVELGAIGMILFFIFMSIAMMRGAMRTGAINWTVIAAWGGFLLNARSDNALATPAYFPLLIVCMLPVAGGLGRAGSATPSTAADKPAPKGLAAAPATS